MYDRKYRALRFLGIVIPLSLLFLCLVVLDLLVSALFSLFDMGSFPGMIDLLEWLAGNPSTIPYAVIFLLLMIIGLEIFSD